MSKRKSKHSVSRSVGSRAFEQLAAMGIVFLLAPYVQAQLMPVRDKIYGAGATPPNQPTGTIPVPAVSNPTGAPPTVMPSVVGDTPSNILNITTPLAPVGDRPAPVAGSPALAPNAGPLGGLFLGA